MHSTETALMKVHKNILCAIDNNECVLLVLLSLSAAFDTTDHQIVVRCVEKELGIKLFVFDWFHSYLSIRTQ